MELNKVFRYEIPTVIEFGNGSIRKLPDHVRSFGGTKVFIVGDPGVVKAGVVERLTDSLQASNIPYVLFSEIESDPDIHSVEVGTELAKNEGCNLVIGVGGGSSLDTAKAIGIMMTNKGNIRDYVGINKVPAPLLL